MKHLADHHQIAMHAENVRIAAGENPRYIVLADTVGSAFLTAELAIAWHHYTYEQGIETHIMDLTDYDWSTNPLKLRMHDTREDVEIDLAMRSQATKASYLN